jgi:hypothetical protein
VYLRRLSVKYSIQTTKNWHQHYDSAWYPTGVVNSVEEAKEENCVKDPRRIVRPNLRWENRAGVRPGDRVPGLEMPWNPAGYKPDTRSK